MTPNPVLGIFSKSRIEAFSDGVFAIVVTLLVFELKFPHIDAATNEKVWQGVLSTLPKLLSWVNSFLIVCVFWMNHHRLMERVKKVDGGIFWFNNLLLMAVSLIPFPTAVLGDYPSTNTATCFYGVCLSLASLAFTFLRLHAQNHPHLLDDAVDMKIFRRATVLAFCYGFLLYLVGAGLSLLYVWMGYLLYFFIALYFIFPRATRTN